MKRIFTLSLVFAFSPLAHAATSDVPVGPAAPSAPALDPAARDVLEQSAQAYAALSSLSMHFVVEGKSSKAKPELSGEIALSYPHLARIEADSASGHIIQVSDGDRVYSQVEPKLYRFSYAEPKDLLPNTIKHLTGSFTLPLSLLVDGKNPLGGRGGGWSKAVLLPDGGVELWKPAARKSPACDYKLYFDPASHYLIRIDATATDKKATHRSSTRFTDIQSNPKFAADFFKYNPADGVELANDPPLFDPRLVPGVVPYELTGKDLQGKPHSWSQYAGKVVLLDFWATWCVPCVGELPNVLANYRKHNSEGFEVLGISGDDSKADLQAFVKKRGIPYPQIFDHAGGKNGVALRFGVHAFPYTLLIGKDGKVAAVNATGEKLEPEIMKALAQ